MGRAMGQVATFHISNATQKTLRYQFPETLPAPLEGVEQLAVAFWVSADVEVVEISHQDCLSELGIICTKMADATHYL